ncbi:MAG: hypothetical protein JNL98_14990 [Bryobacterales bacterium]|nr:hypothetical protein [Bryobacterales bacterium]
MAFRSEAATRAGLIVLLAAVAGAGAELRFDVRHERAAKDHVGVLTVGDDGVVYHQVDPKPPAKPRKKPKKLERQSWAYGDIQQIWISPEKLVVVTYKDRKWRLGIDHEYEFYAAKGQTFRPAYEALKTKLDRRLVAALGDAPQTALWSLRVKLLGTLQGSEGTLKVGEDRIVYETGRKGHSRSWRMEDLENVSTADRYQLTIVTYERAKLHYGSRRAFDFQLKEPMEEARFQALWQKLNERKGLEVLRIE